MMSAAPLLDSFGRVHDNLRISVTDRCNIRCFYCMPETGVQFVERSEILDFEEIERFVRVAVGLGVRKLRVTGGWGSGLRRGERGVFVEVKEIHPSWRGPVGLGVRKLRVTGGEPLVRRDLPV